MWGVCQEVFLDYFVGTDIHGDTLTTMAVPWNGLTKLWASHGIGHHMALGITQHVDTGGTDIHADTLTTMATTRGYAYDDGRSMERPLLTYRHQAQLN